MAVLLLSYSKSFKRFSGEFSYVCEVFRVSGSVGINPFLTKEFELFLEL